MTTHTLLNMLSEMEAQRRLFTQWSRSGPKLSTPLISEMRLGPFYVSASKGSCWQMVGGSVLLELQVSCLQAMLGGVMLRSLSQSSQ